jgi:hypothetical protein
MATMYEISVPIYIRRLNGLAGCLKKAQALYAEKKYDEGRSSTTGYTRTCSASRGRSSRRPTTPATARRSSPASKAPKVENTEKSLSDLVARVENTVNWLKTINAGQVDGTEGKSVTVKTPAGETKFTGMDLLQHRALPNFYFHTTTAYDILRHNGVDLGKRDFMGAA